MAQQASARIGVIADHVTKEIKEEISQPPVLEQVQGHTAILTLNRPESLNALNVEIFLSLRVILQKCEENTNVKLIILKGAGRGYCAGGDIKELSLKTQKHGTEFSRHFFTSEYSLDYYASKVTKTEIVFWNGIAMGGGLGISMYAKYKIATEKTVYAMPEVGIGLFPDVGGSYFLSRMPWPLGLYLGLSTARMDGTDLMHFGVATHYVTSDKLPELEKQLIDMPVYNDETVKKLLTSFSSTPPASNSVVKNWQKIQEIFSLDSVEAIFRALETDNSEWALSTLNKMKTCSPTSLKVTFKQITRGRELDVLQTFKQEYRLALRFMEKHDFFEGVRAVLIDKKSKARWVPGSLEEVSEKEVDKYFALLPPDVEFVPR
eukprot:Phypoly_transcript_10819.p1 GENE.Phypoly_transcript_10819~~Phypoly_transcript_10819.p1  ORF type:complete len:389 (+),score=57.65 Phypoly_transcript_10819:41-1168(+)